MRLGIKAVVAESFNGLGLRNCVNEGLPSLPCPGILNAFEEGDIAEVDAISGIVRNLTSGTTITGNPLPTAHPGDRGCRRRRSHVTCIGTSARRSNT